MNPDPIVEEVRKNRQELAARYSDLRALVEDMHRREKTSGHRIISVPKKRQTG